MAEECALNVSYRDRFRSLKTMFWDLVNHMPIFVVGLDKDQCILMINEYLSKLLGYQSYQELLGRCWLDFVPPEYKNAVTGIHEQLTRYQNPKFYETINEIVSDKDESAEPILVKWFNVPINSAYNMVMSLGLPKREEYLSTEENLRQYYIDLMEKDRVMIDALKTSLFSDQNICIERV